MIEYSLFIYCREVPMTKKLYIKTYGCQMNVYDSDQMVNLLAPLGYEVTDNPDEAHMAILNTCHIREKAEQKMYSDLGRLNQTRKRLKEEKNQDLLIGVGGCVAQAEGDEIIRNAPYVSMVFGPQTYHRLPEMIAQIHKSQAEKEQKPFKGLVDTDFPMESKFDLLPTMEKSSTSAFLSIQEGCDKFCTFCVVPYTRGAETSRPVADIIREAIHLVSLGAKEITLLGQNVNAFHGAAPHISSYGASTWNLARLIEELAKIDGLERIRYTTSHPRDMDDDLIQAHGSIDKLMPYLHLPVQSGSDRILDAMNRKHTAQHYLEIIDKLKQACPAIALSSDFIVGFPGETKADFEDTLHLVCQVKFAQAYSFKYSIRPGTPAGAMDLQVREEDKTERLKILQDLLTEHQQAFNKSLVGTVQPVLFDKTSRFDNHMLGKTPYMQSVHIPVQENLFGKIVNVSLESTVGVNFMGKLV
jgi:tRNA-2-methylthio-N6-dimethylallyladenosine synthase